MRDYSLFIPEYIAASWAVLVIAIELFWPKVRKDYLAYITAAGAVAWGVSALFFIGNEPESFQGLIQSDNFTTYFRLIAAGVVAAVAIMSASYDINSVTGMTTTFLDRSDEYENLVANGRSDEEQSRLAARVIAHAPAMKRQGSAASGILGGIIGDQG